MLMRNSGALQRRTSAFWRVGYATLLAAALVVLVGAMGVRRAEAQAADADQKAAEVERRTAQEQASVAAQRADEVAKLRADQATIIAQLKALEVEKRQLEAELAQRKAEGAKADDVSIYRRTLAQREQAIQQVRDAQEADLAAKMAARRKVEVAVEDKPATVDEKANNDYARFMDRLVRGNAAKEGNDIGGRAQLDLVALADRYVDALGNVQMAQLELDQLIGVVGPEHKEMQTKGAMLKVKLATAQRRLEIFRGIAKAAMEAAKADFELANEQVRSGLAPKSAMMEAQSRMRMLEVILAQ